MKLITFEAIILLWNKKAAYIIYTFHLTNEWLWFELGKHRQLELRADVVNELFCRFCPHLAQTNQHDQFKMTSSGRKKMKQIPATSSYYNTNSSKIVLAPKSFLRWIISAHICFAFSISNFLAFKNLKLYLLN